MDIPTSPLWTLANVPTHATTPAERAAAARVAHQYARTTDEAAMFLHQLGLEAP